MSLSNQTSGSKNPAQKFIKYKSSKGFIYYDKDAKTDVSIPTPFHIIPLDTLATITGWHDASSSGIYSNEVHSTNNENLNVKSFKGGNIVSGKYSDIKNSLQGGKFTSSVYAAMIINGGEDLELVNIHFSGGALSPLIEAGIKPDGSIVEVDINPVQAGKAIKYNVPMFKIHKGRENLTEKAKVIDIELQGYMNQYINDNNDNPDANTPKPKKAVADEPAVTYNGGDDDLPF